MKKLDLCERGFQFESINLWARTVCFFSGHYSLTAEIRVYCDLNRFKNNEYDNLIFVEGGTSWWMNIKDVAFLVVDKVNDKEYKVRECPCSLQPYDCD